MKIALDGQEWKENFDFQLENDEVTQNEFEQMIYGLTSICPNIFDKINPTYAYISIFKLVFFFFFTI